MLNKIYARFEKRILMIGFGSIGPAVLPLIFRHIAVDPKQVTIISKKNDNEKAAQACNVKFVTQEITIHNYQEILKEYVSDGDIIVNLSIDVGSVDIIRYCQERNIRYIDTCIEPWEGGYTDNSIPFGLRSNYAMREHVLALKKPGVTAPTAIVTHGANPGLVSHFVKQALMNIARDNKLDVPRPQSRIEWADLARKLNIKVIHIAERDTQITNATKRRDEFVNTWSVDGFVAEGMQPVELGWGSHERHWPTDAAHHEFGCRSAIYLNRPGASTRVRTWTPAAGPFHGFLITHGESISISDYLTLKDDDVVVYRPTVHYAYHPCEDAVLSLHELAGREWNQQNQSRLIFDEIIEGMDELGVLLMGNQKGAYWFGSQLTIQEARQLAPNNNATSLQVAAGVLSGLIWAIDHPMAGITEPDDMDDEYIMSIVRPYLGKVEGHYTDWTPLQERGRVFPETVDESDPWQFVNIRVN